MSVANGGKLRQHWDDRYYVRVYELRRSGIKDRRSMARVLGVHHHTFNRWFEDKPALRDAWERGTTARDGKRDFTFKDYVFGQLPLPLQQAWREINRVGDDPDAQLKIEEMLGDMGDTARQRLFLHALVCSYWNPSVAAKRVNVSNTTLKRWLAQDPEFAELVNEIEQHKDNFIEENFMRLVDAGDPAVVMHAARTRLRGRGYGEQKDVNVNVQGALQHTHTVLDLNRLVEHLSLAARTELLAAMRRLKLAAGQPLLPGTVIDGRVVRSGPAPVEG